LHDLLINGARELLHIFVLRIAQCLPQSVNACFNLFGSTEFLPLDLALWADHVSDVMLLPVCFGVSLRLRVEWAVD